MIEPSGGARRERWAAMEVAVDGADGRFYTTAGLPALGCRHEPGGGVKKGGRVFNADTTADKSAAIWDRGNASQIGTPIYQP